VTKFTNCPAKLPWKSRASYRRRRSTLLSDLGWRVIVNCESFTGDLVSASITHTLLPDAYWESGSLAASAAAAKFLLSLSCSFA
jgi:hypothetical protein